MIDSVAGRVLFNDFKLNERASCARTIFFGHDHNVPVLIALTASKYDGQQGGDQHACYFAQHSYTLPYEVL